MSVSSRCSVPLPHYALAIWVLLLLKACVMCLYRGPVRQETCSHHLSRCQVRKKDEAHRCGSDHFML